MYKAKDSYLEDEVRDGFYIPSIAKRAWAAELSILHEINRICEKYDIRYFADWGSFLGAVRHQGFIPWDDDLDICMFRSDLNRFINVAEKELPEGFKVHSFLNNDYSWKFIINVVNTERMCFTPEYLKSHYNFPYMATIDIFVIDNVYDNEDTEDERRERVKFILTVADAITEENYKSPKVSELISEIEAKCGSKINRNVEFIELKRQLYKATQDVISEYDNESSEYVVQQIPWGIYNKRKFKRALYDGCVKLPFEDTYICVPKLYDKVLRNKYGNYWEIRMGVGGHGYPYYNVQKESLGLPEDADYIPHYKFNDSLIESADGILKIGGLEDRNETINSINEFKNSPDYQGEFDRETVLFLPYKGHYWDSLRPYYEDEISKENTDVFVVPLPYFYKEYNGALVGEAQYDLSKYPEELPIYLVEQLDLTTMFPDRIYIQNPYDEYNMCMSVPVEYYAKHIRNLTKKLIYVPWFDLSDFSHDNYPSFYNMQYYCTVPGVVLSDEIILHSETVKDRYVERLTEFAGENTKAIWENKIKVVSRLSKEEKEGQEGQEDKVENAGNTSNTDSIKKKTLLYYTCASTILEYGDSYVEKINDCIDLFIKNEDSLSVIWCFEKSSQKILKEYDSDLYQTIIKIIDSISSYESVKVVDTYSKDLLVLCDAYYGDPSYISKDFNISGKPIMIANTLIR